MRGSLTFAEYGQYLPFVPQRFFLVFDVLSREVRGEHAHKKLDQFLVCVHGRCHVVADNGTVRQEFVLNQPSVRIHLPPMIWGIQYQYSEDAVLLGLASEPYDSDDYIRSYSEFLQARLPMHAADAGW